MNRTALLLLTLALFAPPLPGRNALVLQTDFGTRDGAVAAMKGVAFSVDADLPIHDLSHENTPYDIWEASYRLKQTVAYWPKGTVFVSVIDPGVGTTRKSVVLLSKSGHFIVTPDNGTLTHVAEDLGIAAVRAIDESLNRLEHSERSHTFHGRDVYALTGARLAAGIIAFEEVGPLLKPAVVTLPHTPARFEAGVIHGGIPALDARYGNVWTNIPVDLFEQLDVTHGDRLSVRITQHDTLVFSADVPYSFTFGDVPEGEPLLYLNSLLNVSLALNQADFAGTHGIRSGGEWQVRIQKPD